MINETRVGSRSAEPFRVPVLAITPHDRVVAALMTTASASTIVLAVVVIFWLTSSVLESFPPEGSERRAVMAQPLNDHAGENPLLVAPEVAFPDSAIGDNSVANEERDVTELNTETEAVEEAAEAAGELASAEVNADREGNDSLSLATGSGGSPIGRGLSRGGANDRRWFIEFTEASSLAQYAGQLAFFRIEPGMVLNDEGRIVYLSDLTKEKPTTRILLKEDAADEQRYFMNWTDGSNSLLEADRALFAKAGIELSDAPILHFYTDETVAILEKLEREYAGDSNPLRIRRTYFGVRRNADGYEFYVTRQLMR